MNGAELRDAVYDRLGVSAADPQFPAPLVNRAVNGAVHFVETARDWPWLGKVGSFDTVAGVGDYAPPADWARTKKLKIGSDPALHRVDIDTLEDDWDPDSRGLPEAWAVFGDRIYLRPVPDAVYSVRHLYFRAEPDIADESSPLMPARFHLAVAEVATWFCLKRSNEDARAVAAKVTYDQWEARMIDDADRYSGPARVRVRSEY